eukprot:Amastigsp_a388_12.p6 type:complete len:134 gc:universal Amastigsp_a388_12:2196-2597(+)
MFFRCGSHRSRSVCDGRWASCAGWHTSTARVLCIATSRARTFSSPSKAKSKSQTLARPQNSEPLRAPRARKARCRSRSLGPRPKCSEEGDPRVSRTCSRSEFCSGNCSHAGGLTPTWPPRLFLTMSATAAAPI